MQNSISSFRYILALIKNNLSFIICFLLTVFLSGINIRFLYSGIILCTFLMPKRKSLFLMQDKQYVLVFITMTFFSLSAYIANNITIINALMYMLMSILFYTFGKSYGNSCEDENSVLFWLFFMAFSISFPHIFYTVRDILETGLINPERVLMTLDDDQQRAVTQRTVELSLALGGISAVSFYGKNRETNTIIISFVVLSIVSLLCVLHYVSRTGLVIFATAFVMGILLKRKINMYTIVIFLLRVVISS